MSSSGAIRELPAHVLHVRVDGPIQHDPPILVELVHQLIARIDPSGRCGERLQEAELDPRTTRPPVERDLESRSSTTRRSAVTLRRRGESAAQHGPDPRNDLARTERLADVIVGAELQAQQPVDLVDARRHDDDRNRRERAHLAADGQPVLAGKHQVEQHQRRVVLADFGDCRGAIVDAARREAVGAEVVGQQARELRLVLDDQDQRRVGLAHAMCRERKADSMRNPPSADALAPMSPPCISTMLRHSARPSPARRAPGSTRNSRSNSRGSRCAGTPGAGSSTPARRIRRRRKAQAHAPARIGVRKRVLEQVVEELRQPPRVSPTTRRGPGNGGRVDAPATFRSRSRNA